MNRKFLFDKLRHQPFPGSIASQAVQGIEAILNEWERRNLTDLRWLAYMLATAFHETNRTMQPIHEIGNAAYFTRLYDIGGSRPDTARKYGNVNPGDGARYCGRGYVQLTWRNNYRAMGGLLGKPLEEHPDLAVEPTIAAAIMFEGMIRGTFTGKKLSDYFDGSHTDWTNARKIINALDKAETIASYARQFHGALIAAQEAPADVVPPPPDIPKQINPVVPIAQPPSPVANTVGGVGGIGTVVATSVIAHESSKKGASTSEVVTVLICGLLISLAVVVVIRSMWKK